VSHEVSAGTWRPAALRATLLVKIRASSRAIQRWSPRQQQRFLQVQPELSRVSRRNWPSRCGYCESRRRSCARKWACCGRLCRREQSWARQQTPCRVSLRRGLSPLRPHPRQHQPQVSHRDHPPAFRPGHQWQSPLQRSPQLRYHPHQLLPPSQQGGCPER